MNRLVIVLIFLVTIFAVMAASFGVYRLGNLFYREISLTQTHTQPFAASGVVPHHLMAKEIIEDFFKELSLKGNYKTIVLLSPDHFNRGALCDKSAFIALEQGSKEFVDFKVDNSLLKGLCDRAEICPNNSFVSLDHGITNLLPYIKEYFPQSKLLPILIPSNISEDQIIQLITAIDSYNSSQIIVLASVDFSHYLPKTAAEFHDVKSIRALLNFEKENFQNLEVDCWQCLYGARLFAELRQKESPKIIRYSNSADFSTNKNAEETTSYFSVIFEKKNLQKLNQQESFDGKTILFVGDMMLDRGVEYLMKKNSIFYPFEKINQFLRGIDIVFGNLEGPIVKNPPNFSDDSLKFAFLPGTIKGLSFSNFNLLSLANNHTFNMGESGLEETEELLEQGNINFVGHPVSCDENFLFKEDEIIFLAFNKTFPFNCSNEEIVEIIKETRNSEQEKFLVVVFHWGQEYQPKSSIVQQKLAHQIIEAGADLIIGSHPHIIQEVEEYKGKMIFYSLGNFIFDQYFSEETQQGLAVGLEIYPKKIIYRIFPVQSHLSQPFLMKQEEADKFLEELAQKSSVALFDEIKAGIITIER